MSDKGDATVAIDSMDKIEKEMAELSEAKQEKLENCCVSNLASCIFHNYCGTDAICNVMTHVLLILTVGVIAGAIAYWMVNSLGFAESEIDEEWASHSGPVKGIVGFIMGFYIWGLMGYRSGYLDQFTVTIQCFNRVLQTLNSIGSVPDDAKADIQRYMVCAFQCFFAHANDEMDFAAKGDFIHRLVDNGAMTEGEYQTIDDATEGSFDWCHRIPFAWVNATLGAQDLSVPQRVALGGLVGKAQDKLEDDPAGDIPLVFQFIINAIVVFCCVMDSLTTGLTISEQIDDGVKNLMLFFCLFFQLIFNIALLEFCRQMVNNITGEDCLDVDYAASISQLAREMKVHWKYAKPEDANPAEDA